MIKRRFRILIFLFSFFFAVVFFRALLLQVFPTKRLQSFARIKNNKKLTIAGRRGTIFDRKGKILAMSEDTFSIYVDPKYIKNTSKLLRKIASFDGSLNIRKLEKKIKRAKKNNRRFLWIKRQLNEAQRKNFFKVALNSIDGVYTLKEFKRIYPYQRTASHVLGFVGLDGKGLAGVEASLDKHLQNRNIIYEVERDARGRNLYKELDAISLKRKFNNDVELTIDVNVQYLVEKYLKEHIEKNQAQSGLVLVADARSGELLAMANFPDYNPNYGSKASPSSRRNLSISNPIEPGSVVKSFVVAQALEDRLMNENSNIKINKGELQYKHRKIYDSHSHLKKFNYIKLKELLKYSSNVATIKVAEKIGLKKLLKVYDEVGYNKKVSVALRGESKGLFRAPASSDGYKQMALSFGHGLAVTPLQVLRSYTVFTNDGKLLPIKLVNKPNVLTEQKVKEVFTKKTARRMQKLLNQVSLGDGTAAKARLPYFSVAGKTGTSQKYDAELGRYSHKKFRASFVGFVPAKQSRFLMYVMLDEPMKDGHSGSQVAAPLFAKIAKELVRFVGSGPVLAR